MGCKRDVDFSYLANTYLINPFNQRIHKSKDMNWKLESFLKAHQDQRIKREHAKTEWEI